MSTPKSSISDIYLFPVGKAPVSPVSSRPPMYSGQVAICPFVSIFQGEVAKFYYQPAPKISKRKLHLVLPERLHFTKTQKRCILHSQIGNVDTLGTHPHCQSAIDNWGIWVLANVSILFTGIGFIVFGRYLPF